MPEDTNTYIFKLLGSQEIHEVEAEDSAEALRLCLREKKWPVEKVAYVGKKEKT